MKRQWRILGAVLLLSIAAATCLIWPVGPRWQIPVERPAGFDLERGLLLTTKYESESKEFELHGFDLVTGERKVCMPVPIEDINQAYHPDWKTQSSADGSKLVCWNRSGSIIQVFDVRQQCRRICDIKTPRASVDSINLSFDGCLLAFRNNNDVQIWDCKEGKVVKHLTMPEDSMQKLRMTSVRLPIGPDAMQFSRDNKKLSVSSDTHESVVFDIESGQMIGRSPNWRPQFLEDNKTLVTFPGRLLSGETNWYEIKEQKLNLLPQTMKFEPGSFLLGAGKDRFYSCSIDEIENNLKMPDWIPGVARPLVKSVYWKLYRPFTVESWDLNTGKRTGEFKIAFKLSILSFLSSDGLLMAIEDREELCLWDMPPRRASGCRLACIGLVVLAIYCVWPRRVIKPA